jgi:hypothetical protein
VGAKRTDTFTAPGNAAAFGTSRAVEFSTALEGCDEPHSAARLDLARFLARLDDA